MSLSWSDKSGQINKQIHCGRDLSHIQRPKLRVGFLLEYNFEILVQILNQTKLTSIVFFFRYGSQWRPATVWLPIFFKILSFLFNRTKKVIEV